MSVMSPFHGKVNQVLVEHNHPGPTWGEACPPFSGLNPPVSEDTDFLGVVDSGLHCVGEVTTLLGPSCNRNTGSLKHHPILSCGNGLVKTPGSNLEVPHVMEP